MPESWTPLAIGIVGCCVLLYGASKTAMPSAGVLAGPVLAAVLTPTIASAFVVPLLVVGDLFALARYRQHVQWRLILRLLPGLAVGFALAAAAFAYLETSVLARLLGVLILTSVTLEILRQRAVARSPDGQVARPSVATSAFFGTLAGMTTMGANAGGAAMTLYLLSMRVPMLAFMGTSAWFFFILNVIKIPIVVGLGFLTADSLLVDLAYLPVLVIGALVGSWVFDRMNQDAFNRTALVLSGVAGVWLLVHG